MRPPSHPAATASGRGTLYEPGAHTLLFASLKIDAPPSYDVHVLRLPWLFVGQTFVTEVYYSCDALLFSVDPRASPSKFVPYSRLSTLLGNGVGPGRLCLGHIGRVGEVADLWNTAFMSASRAEGWRRMLARAGGDPCLALRTCEEGHTMVWTP